MLQTKCTKHTYTGHSMKKKKKWNIHSFQMRMEHSLVQMTYTRGYRTNVNKFNKTENIPAISSDHSGMTIEI